MAIQTGMVKGAGTKSKLYFYVVGDLGRSRIHVVEDPYRSILKRDSKDLFLLSTPKYVLLNGLQNFIDNTGFPYHFFNFNWYPSVCYVCEAQAEV